MTDKKKKVLSATHKKSIALSVTKSWDARRKVHSADIVLASAHEVPQGKKIKPGQLISIARNRDVFRQTFLNLTASTIRSILDSTRTGELLHWYEFVEMMAEDDPALRSLVRKRKGAISAKELKIISADPSDEAANAAAELVRKAIEDIPDLDRSLRQLLEGIFSGMGALEILWTRKQLGDFTRVWAPEVLEQIPGKRFRIGEHNGRWRYYLHDYARFANNDDNPVYKHPDKFIIHSPGDEDFPHYRGLLRALAFYYYFKKVDLVYWLGGAEKFAFPSIYALVPNSTPDNIRVALAGDLRSLTSDGAAVLNSDVEIKTIGSGATGGDIVWRSIMQHIETTMAKLILGGTLVVEASTGPGGNRALGEVHERSAQEIIDGDARALEETLRFQLVEPLIRKNLHLFGGEMPPLPKIKFDVVNREPVELGQSDLQAAAFTKNEWRKTRGFPPVPWGEEIAVFGGAVEQTEDDIDNGEADSSNQVDTPEVSDDEVQELTKHKNIYDDDDEANK